MSRPVMRRSASGGSPKPTAQDAGGGGGFEPRPASQAAGDQEYDYVRAVPFCSGVGLACLWTRVGCRHPSLASCARPHASAFALPCLPETVNKATHCLTKLCAGLVWRCQPGGRCRGPGDAAARDAAGAGLRLWGLRWGVLGRLHGGRRFADRCAQTCILADAFAGWWLISMVVAQSKSWTRRRLRSASAAARPA